MRSKIIVQLLPLLLLFSLMVRPANGSVYTDVKAQTEIQFSENGENTDSEEQEPDIKELPAAGPASSYLVKYNTTTCDPEAGLQSGSRQKPKLPPKLG